MGLYLYVIAGIDDEAGYVVGGAVDVLFGPLLGSVHAVTQCVMVDVEQA